ncbi:hypothetical protein D9V96_014320 [Zobellia laminariae]|uniref:Oligoendopeptidase F n=1 Tax=Zobellia barbeyronii TaxID=2748009 RepID=A0ABS5WHE6_9FLAO|nr:MULTISPECIES: hypothetical protein [Zobellia]MBT2161617.1 hypothetical protein [Zobellia barbeyronii]MUH41429.1 hypothetical protein [Zobellia laminariae]WKX76879.1 hypothetical protein Q5W13_01525 [Zobellia laminariae]
MKTETLNPKTELLIGAGLDVLHFESEEWLSNIAFYKDETRFFADLIEKRKTNDAAQTAYGQILENLDTVHKELFDYLENDIIEHEKLLSRLELGEKGLADADYRDKHRQLKQRMEGFTNNFRQFKKMVFGYVKSL